MQSTSRPKANRAEQPVLSIDDWDQKCWTKLATAQERKNELKNERYYLNAEKL